MVLIVAGVALAPVVYHLQSRGAFLVLLFVVSRLVWSTVGPLSRASKCLNAPLVSHYHRPFAYALPPGWTQQEQGPADEGHRSILLQSADAWVEVVYVPGGRVTEDQVWTWLRGFEADERTHDLRSFERTVAGFGLSGATVTVTKNLSAWVAGSCAGQTLHGGLGLRFTRSLFTRQAVIDRILDSLELEEETPPPPSPDSE